MKNVMMEIILMEMDVLQLVSLKEVQVEEGEAALQQKTEFQVNHTFE